MNPKRPVGRIRIIGATPRAPEITDQLPWYGNRIGEKFTVYLDYEGEFPLVNPKDAGDYAYYAISAVDAEILK